MDAWRRETLQQLQAASTDLQAEGRVVGRLRVWGDNQPGLLELWGGLLQLDLSPWRLRQAAPSHWWPLSEWVVSVTYHNLLNQSILMPYHASPQVFVLSWSSLGFLLNYSLLFACRCCGNWGRQRNLRDMQPTWSDRDSWCYRWLWWVPLPVGWWTLSLQGYTEPVSWFPLFLRPHLPVLGRQWVPSTVGQSPEKAHHYPTS